MSLFTVIGQLIPYVLAFIAFCFLVGLVHHMLRRQSHRRRKARSSERDPVLCLRCGYNLRGLEVPRCPECGTLRGFRVPLDRLGLTEADLRRKREAGQREQDEGNGSDA